MQKPNLRLHPKTGRPIMPLGVVGGKTVWPIMGAAPNDPDDDKGGKDDDEDKGGDRTFTQDDVNRMMTSEKRQGRDAGQRELLDSLGFKDADEATAYLQRVRKQEEDNLTDQQRREREIESKETQAERERREAAEEKHTSRMERALIRRGVDEDDLDDAVVLLSRNVKQGDDLDTIAEAADSLKERRAELFGGRDEDDQDQDRRRRGGELPTGRPRERNRPSGAPFGAGGLAEAKRRGFIKDDKD